MHSANKFYLVLLVGCLIFSAGCWKTFAPPPVKPAGASFDNGERNSGFYGFVTNNGVPYGLISTNARNRYNELIYKYKGKFIPPLKKDYGISDNKTNYLITLEALSKFATMNRWRKEESK